MLELEREDLCNAVAKAILLKRILYPELEEIFLRECQKSRLKLSKIQCAKLIRKNEAAHLLNFPHWLLRMFSRFVQKTQSEFYKFDQREAYQIPSGSDYLYHLQIST